ncbi:LIC12048 family lipoprotein [Leptospira sp. B5-022]|uniref:LIC12048 family lipoprotein n=2 Tax=unclassified Leptospira TaxID=2633828 RepID=UPI0002BFB5C8|nr:LIC12048 family lipoprotein [Leptospira sp. B5-022]EMJ99162.1 putative lipoprotein [Leptospira sp. B5-022]
MKSLVNRNVFGIGFVLILVLTFFSCLGDWGFSSRDVNLSRATWLVTQKVPLVVDKGGTGAPGVVTPVNNLFLLPPGTKVSAQALGGTIDPTGTTILNDFDGDGILNIHETTTNIWVADYPDIDTVIAPPVTMKIEIQENSVGVQDEIISEINSDDFESTKVNGSEKIHQKEVNLRTVQYVDKFSSSLSLGQSTGSSSNYGASIGASSIGPQLGLSYGTSSSNSYNVANSISVETTKWRDKPFKNDLDRDAWSLKSEATGKKARKYRSEKTSKINTTSKVDADAGYVRAALYIKNQSVNMPVKLKNILCSLMFETGDGDLIPVTSFKLLNQDYSPFEVEVYGGSEFGPYVIEVNKLNRVEVEKAITAGYNPKIFIVDYEMTHVADSNYRSALLNFTGDNLKIVEENAKGRTGLVKIYGPNIRESFRVAAFDTPGNADPCTTASASTLSPGITLQKVLSRIACSGIEIKYQDYIVDFSEFAPALAQSRTHIKGIKSIGGVENTIPCDMVTSTGSDGVSRTACAQRPFSSWTEEQKNAAGVWTIFSNGKYYEFTEYFKDGQAIRYFDPTSPRKAPMLKGTDSIVWAGDYFDIVYISVKDFIKQEEYFGTNPLVTNASFKMNTAWDLPALGENPYYPATKSTYLGSAGFGEQIELNIKLDKTRYLKPNFGLPENAGAFQYFWDFKYDLNRPVTSNLYDITQAADFEISMSLGGTRTDWIHIEKGILPIGNDNYKIESCGKTYRLAEQTFTICLRLPNLHSSLDINNTIIDLYLRPSLNTAYRNTVWPLPYTEVKKMRGELGAPTVTGSFSIQVANLSGIMELGDIIQIEGDSTPYTIVGPAPTVDSEGVYTVNVDTAIRPDIKKKTTRVYINGNLTGPDVRLAVDNGFYTEWTTHVNTNFQAGNYNAAQFNTPFLSTNAVNCNTVNNMFHPAACLGFTPDYNAVNWMGVFNQGVAAWNSWADGGNFQGFLANGLLRLPVASGKSYRLESSNNDYLINENVGVTTLSEPKTVSQGDIALAVWKQDSNLRGKFYQISTGSPPPGATTSFQINSVNNSVTGRFKLKVLNGRAVIAWENNANIVIAARDMTSFAAIGTEQLVTTRLSSGTANFALAMGLNRAFVFWINGFPNAYSIRGQLFDLSSGAITAVGSNFITSTGGGNLPYIDADGGGGDRVVVGYVYSNWVDRWYVINTSMYDCNTGLAIGPPKLVIFHPGGGFIWNFWVKATDQSALSIWKRSDNALIGRGMAVHDISPSILGGALLGPGNFTLDTNVLEADLQVSGNWGLVSYSSTRNKSVYLRVVDMLEGALQYGGTPFSMESSTKSTGVQSRKPRYTALHDNTIISLWEHEESSKKTIRGRTITLSPALALKGPGEFFLSTTNFGNQSGPGIVLNGTSGFAAWWSQDATQQNIRGFNVDILNPGALQYGLNNFFVAPLIERDYTIWSRVRF